MHPIRLRHPWQREWQSGTGSSTTVTNSGDRSPLPRALYRRSFNRPSGLLPEQAVWLVIEPAQPQGPSQQSAQPGCHLLSLRALKLNSLPIEWVAQNGQLRTQIAQQLAPFNQLELVCELSAQPPSPPELGELLEVRLEIAH